MARGRMISRTLGVSSKKYARLRERHSDVGLFAQALYPLLVACSDDFGRLDGDAFSVKHSMWSTAPEPEEVFEQALTALHAEKLIVRYRVGESLYAQVVDFDEHQIGLHKRTDSRFPEPPADAPEVPSTTPEVPGNSGSREENRTEQKGREETRAPEAGPTRKPPAGRSDGVFAGSLPRDHVTHAECSPNMALCVPSAVHGKLRAALQPRYGGDQEQADRALRAWYAEVWRALPVDTVMGDAFRFWQPRFDSKFASAPVSSKPATPYPVPDAETTKRLNAAPDPSTLVRGGIKDAVRKAAQAARGGVQ